MENFHILDSINGLKAPFTHAALNLLGFQPHGIQPVFHDTHDKQCHKYQYSTHHHCHFKIHQQKGYAQKNRNNGFTRQLYIFHQDGKYLGHITVNQTEYGRDIRIEIKFIRTVQVLFQHIAYRTELISIHESGLGIGQKQQEKIFHHNDNDNQKKQKQNKLGVVLPVQFKPEKQTNLLYHFTLQHTILINDCRNQRQNRRNPYGFQYPADKNKNRQQAYLPFLFLT